MHTSKIHTEEKKPMLSSAKNICLWVGTALCCSSTKIKVSKYQLNVPTMAFLVLGNWTLCGLTILGNLSNFKLVPKRAPKLHTLWCLIEVVGLWAIRAMKLKLIDSDGMLLQNGGYRLLAKWMLRLKPENMWELLCGMTWRLNSLWLSRLIHCNCYTIQR